MADRSLYSRTLALTHLMLSPIWTNKNLFQNIYNNPKLVHDDRKYLQHGTYIFIFGFRFSGMVNIITH